MMDSHSDEEGVIGYQATTVQPAITQPSAAAALPSIRIFSAGLVHPLDAERILLGEVRFRVIPPRFERAPVQRDGFRLLAKLPAERLFHQWQIDAQQLRQDAVVDHVADEAAQLRVGTHGSDQFVEGHGIRRRHVAVRSVSSLSGAS